MSTDDKKKVAKWVASLTIIFQAAIEVIKAFTM